MNHRHVQNSLGTMESFCLVIGDRPRIVAPDSRPRDLSGLQDDSDVEDETEDVKDEDELTV